MLKFSVPHHMPISYHDMRDDNAFKNAYQIPSHFQLNIFWPHFPSVPSIEQACCLVQQMLGSNYSCNIKKLHFKLKIVVFNRAHVNRIQYKKNNYNRNIPSHCIRTRPSVDGKLSRETKIEKKHAPICIIWIAKQRRKENVSFHFILEIPNKFQRKGWYVGKYSNVFLNR